MNNPLELFVEIIETASDWYVRPDGNTTLGELFQDPVAFTPLLFELCVDSLSATLRRHIDYDFGDGDLMRDAHVTLSEFLELYMRGWVSDDPLFVTRQFLVFAQRAQWISDFLDIPGGN